MHAGASDVTGRTTALGGSDPLTWLHSPFAVGLLAAAGALAVVVLRLVIVAHGNVATFIIVGTLHADPSRLPLGIPVVRGPGYDGQFYYRMALSPLDWHPVAHGIHLDTMARLERIAYPALAWMVALGRVSLVPTTMVAVNVVGVGALGVVGGFLALDAGRRALWGLVFPGYWGMLWTVSRDLTEVVTAVFLLGGLFALRRRRPVLAGVSLAVAILSRETVAVMLIAIFVARVVSWVRPHRVEETAPGDTEAGPRRAGVRLTAEDWAWFLPGLAFLAWELAIRVKTGSVPLLASGQRNLGTPFVGVARGLGHYLTRLPSTASLLWLGEVAVLTAIVVAAGVALRSGGLLLHEKLAWAGYVLLSLSLSSGIWLGDVGFRSLDEVYLLSCMSLLYSKRRLLEPAAVLVAAAWFVVGVELAFFL